MNAHHLPPRRGIAMMLVLISLMMGTVLAVSFLSSNDNSAAIGNNIEAAEEARWNALTGMEIGLAILETEVDWRALHTSGALLSNYAVGNGTITIDIVDIETGLPPTAGSRLIQMTVISTVGGVDQIAVSTATVGSSSNSLDLDLSEFAVFASQGINLNKNAMVTRWTAAPSSALGKRIAIGTQSTTAMSINLNLSSAIIDATVYHGPGASASLVTNSTGPLINQIGLFDQIPLPASPMPTPVPLPLGQISTAPDFFPTAPVVISADTRYATIQPSNSTGVLTLQGNITVTADTLLRFKKNSGMIINGNVNLVVFGDLQMDPATYIELAPGATLTVFVGGNLILKDAYIGDERVDKMVFDTSGLSPVIDLNRILIYDFDNGLGTNKTWKLQNTSIVKGQVYAPSATVSMVKQATIYGRVASLALNMTDTATIYYDHSLSTGGGFTDPYSQIFDAGGRIKADIFSLSSLAATDFKLLADTMNLMIQAKNALIYYAGYVAPIPVAPPPGNPTPRPVVVERQLLTFGSSINTWESGKIPVKTATVTKFLRVQ